jgi:hypothetical protein
MAKSLNIFVQYSILLYSRILTTDVISSNTPVQNKNLIFQSISYIFSQFNFQTDSPFTNQLWIKIISYQNLNFLYRSVAYLKSNAFTSPFAQNSDYQKAFVESYTCYVPK